MSYERSKKHRKDIPEKISNEVDIHSRVFATTASAITKITMNYPKYSFVRTTKKFTKTVRKQLLK